MRSLEHARTAGREARQEVGPAAERLLERVEQHISDAYRLFPTPFAPEALEGSAAEVSPEEGMLPYDQRLDRDPAAKLVKLVHELGHLRLHKRLTDRSIPADPVLASIYSGSGASALARYSERSQEECEAQAFMLEFLCPPEALFEEWLASPTVDSTVLAESHGVPVEIVQIQLADGLHRHLCEKAPCEDGQATSPAEPTPVQWEFATLTGVPVLGDAGPGTGKTKTLILRVAHLLRDRGALPEQLLALTFSNEAVAELHERIEREFDLETADQVNAVTFHGFGYRFLHHHAQLLGMEGDLALLDEAAQAELISQILGDVRCDEILDLREPDNTIGAVASYITFLKDRLVTPDDLDAAIAGWGDDDGDSASQAKAQALARLFRAYEREKHARCAVDFADLILLPIRILREHSELRAQYVERHPWVLVDEYQDVSRSVAMLLQQLSDETNPPWVVGDPRQSIYRFRGAAPENVTLFAEDFPAAVTRTLDVNYRSGEGVVHTANALASLLADPHGEVDVSGPWRAANDLPPLDGVPVRIAVANCDAAERAGIVTQVETWLDLGAAPSDIAVLARTNAHVREIALTLNERGIRTVTSGLITPEGAAGTLAAVVTFLDAPRAVLPRLAYSLAAGSCPGGALNQMVTEMLSITGTDNTLQPSGVPGVEGVEEKLLRLQESLLRLRFSGDGWAVLCAFLFDASDYLRDLLRRRDEPGSMIAIEEILSTLSLAAAYRFTHRRANRRLSRIGFGQRLRESLSSPISGLTTPQLPAQAVRVMTCHASKGLEFPYVIVAGQTLPTNPRDFGWIPISLRPPAADDAAQADSLLFVGVTRAKRGVVVSYAATAGGTSRSRERPVSTLLERWRERGGVPVVTWEEKTRDERQTVTIGRIWGGSLPPAVSVYLLSGEGCGIRTYMKDHLSMAFPSATPALYPAFVGMSRRAIERIIELANARGEPVSLEEAEAIFTEAWDDGGWADHPHLSLYRRHGRVRVFGIADAYHPQGERRETLPAEISIEVEGGVRMIRLGLIGYYRRPSGERIALALRAESFATEKDLEKGIAWGTLKKASHRLPFVLLYGGEGTLQPQIFSVEDGQIYPLQWSRQKPLETIDKLAARARDELRGGLQGVFTATIKRWDCDRCSHRLVCPHWIDAAVDETAVE
jgi:DNA helicase-2/ATP-dependent DNA helicase PcrA